MPIMAAAVALLRPSDSIELIQGSPREMPNVFRASKVGCNIITTTDAVRANVRSGYRL
jgi:hypothetical protein